MSVAQLEIIDCVVCGATQENQKQVFEIKDYPVHLKDESASIEFSVSLCKGCGLLYQNPRSGVDLYRKYYENCSQFKRPNYNAGQIKLRELQLDFLNRNVKGKRDIVDVGCGSGYFLNMLRKDGWSVFGIEPSRSACQVAKEDFNIDVYNCFLEEYEEDQLFDVVCMRHVIEHLHDPVKMLEKANTILKDDGYVCLELQDVSKMNSDLITYFYFEHLFYFTPDSISNLVKKAGFEVTALEQTLNPLDSDSPYSVIRILAKKKNSANAEFTSDFQTMDREVSDYFVNLRSKYDEKTNLTKIRDYLAQSSDTVAIWGASWHTVFVQKTLGFDFDVDYYIDSNEEKIGTKYLGKEVVASSQIGEKGIKDVIISSQAFENEIYGQLCELGFPENHIHRMYGEYLA